MARTPIHPGEHLKEELAELGLSASELARQIRVPPNRLTGIINGTRSMTADTALRLGHWFGTSADFWKVLNQPNFGPPPEKVIEMPVKPLITSQAPEARV